MNHVFKVGRDKNAVLNQYVIDENLLLFSNVSDLTIWVKNVFIHESK